MTADVVEAVVQVGENETRYLRCGRGRCLVVIALDAAERQRLLRQWSGSHRVVAPFLPPQATSSPGLTRIADWLRGVLDGLGLEQADVLLAEDAAALQPVLADGLAERVWRVDRRRK